MNVIKEGERVDASAATLLNMLNVSPFTYGLIVQQVYDSGTVFEPKILDIKPEALRTRFMEVIYEAFKIFHSHSDVKFKMTLEQPLDPEMGEPSEGQSLWY